jgi:hypothetical protein
LGKNAEKATGNEEAGTNNTYYIKYEGDKEELKKNQLTVT